MKDESLTPLVREAYADLEPPPFPANAVAAARAAAPRGERGPLLRRSLGLASVFLVGALLGAVPWAAHDRLLATLRQIVSFPPGKVRFTDNRAVSLTEARRRVSFPIAVPRGIPLSEVRLENANHDVQLVVEPVRGTRVNMLEFANAGHPRVFSFVDDGQGGIRKETAAHWTVGRTYVTVFGRQPDDPVVVRLRQAMGELSR